MRLGDQRESDNVEDVRGSSGGGFGGRTIGIGGVVIALVASYFLGVDPSVLLGMMGGGGESPTAQVHRRQATVTALRALTQLRLHGSKATRQERQHGSSRRERRRRGGRQEPLLADSPRQEAEPHVQSAGAADAPLQVKPLCQLEADRLQQPSTP